ncbi:MAG: hypothetical protein BGO78_16805 [Chloroflexi bacterium 44-23]|nr:MAG: hypothetical protein BGO78_16805 [Chloroflexi bacterium 44-23]
MNKTITFTINGQQQTLEVEPGTMLIDLIRDQLNLTGTKRGCDNATCGSCVIIMDGKAVKSCSMPSEKADQKNIFTIEGISKGMHLHVIQQELIQSGAIQCGFCTPGIVNELVALFDQKPNCSETEIITAINKHLCRCTGYEPILEGTLKAQKKLLG